MKSLKFTPPKRPPRERKQHPNVVCKKKLLLQENLKSNGFVKTKCKFLVETFQEAQKDKTLQKALKNDTFWKRRATAKKRWND